MDIGVRRSDLTLDQQHIKPSSLHRRERGRVVLAGYWGVKDSPSPNIHLILLILLGTISKYSVFCGIFGASHTGSQGFI
jgi:hypothetical protein